MMEDDVHTKSKIKDLHDRVCHLLEREIRLGRHFLGDLPPEVVHDDGHRLHDGRPRLLDELRPRRVRGQRDGRVVGAFDGVKLIHVGGEAVQDVVQRLPQHIPEFVDRGIAVDPAHQGIEKLADPGPEVCPDEDLVDPFHHETEADVEGEVEHSPQVLADRTQCLDAADVVEVQLVSQVL